MHVIIKDAGMEKYVGVCICESGNCVLKLILDLGFFGSAYNFQSDTYVDNHLYSVISFIAKVETNLCIAQKCWLTFIEKLHTQNEKYIQKIFKKKVLESRFNQKIHFK